ERTRKALHCAVDDGVPVVLVSGRPPRWLAPVAELAGLTGYAVCSNGAVLYDVGADEVLGIRGLEPGTLHRAAEAWATALPGCRFGAGRVARSAYADARVRCRSGRGYHNPWGDVDEMVASRADGLAEPAVKLLVSDPNRTSDTMAAAARAVL